MKVGLLWFDDNPKHNLTEKITRAAKRYCEKHGTAPDVCYVHKSALGGNGQTAQIGQIQVETLPSVPPHHLWIGQKDQPPPLTK